jgi:hypothetical protein
MKFQNTESVFSVIGDYPVVDQFDVLYSNLMSGSTYDNYITGTLLTKSSLNGTYYYVQGKRGFVFSKLGVNQNDVPGKDLTDENRSYGLQPWRERAGTIRNVKIFSNSERFYDSLTPSFSELIAAYGGEIIYSGGARNTLTLNLGNFGNGKNAGFLETFPFERKFSKVKRVERLANSFFEYDQNSNLSRQSRNISIFMLDTQSALNGVTTSGVQVVSRQDVPYSGVIQFGPLEQGKVAVIVRALYGLKSSGAMWRSHFAAHLREMGLTSSLGDPDVWLRAAEKPDKSEYYEYILVYVDDLLIVSKRIKTFGR